ncbi:MAG TPA: hypothetical protein VEM39_06365 [Myxococcaceae bacterium]|nr:hypothetical protein [Myxococcaceae bacterium]
MACGPIDFRRRATAATAKVTPLVMTNFSRSAKVKVLVLPGLAGRNQSLGTILHSLTGGE